MRNDNIIMSQCFLFVDLKKQENIIFIAVTSFVPVCFKSAKVAVPLFALAPSLLVTSFFLSVLKVKGANELHMLQLQIAALRSRHESHFLILTLLSSR